MSLVVPLPQQDQAEENRQDDGGDVADEEVQHRHRRLQLGEHGRDRQQPALGRTTSHNAG